MTRLTLKLRSEKTGEVCDTDSYLIPTNNLEKIETEFEVEFPDHKPQRFTLILDFDPPLINPEADG